MDASPPKIPLVNRAEGCPVPAHGRLCHATRHLKRDLGTKKGNTLVIITGLHRLGLPTLKHVIRGLGVRHLSRGKNTSTETPLCIFSSGKSSPAHLKSPASSLFHAVHGRMLLKIGARNMFGTKLKPCLEIKLGKGVECESMCALDGGRCDADLIVLYEPALERGYKGNGFPLVLGPSVVRSISLRE